MEIDTQSWSDLSDKYAISHLYWFSIVCMLLLGFVAIGPLWYQRRVHLTVDKPIEEFTPEKEVDRKLALLYAIDSFNQELCEFYNRNWRKEIVLDISQPERQRVKSKKWAKTTREQLDRLQRALGRQELPHLEQTHNIEADVEDTRSSKCELWFDLQGFKANLGEELRAEDNEEIKGLTQKLQEALAKGEETKGELSLFEKIYVIQQKYGKAVIPLAMVDTLYEECRQDT